MRLENKETAPFWYKFGRFVFKCLFVLIYRMKMEGMENVPMTGPVIIAPNHLSYFDPQLVGVALKRPLNFMAKSELFKAPIIGYLIKRMNAFPVVRGTQDREALRRALNLLKDNKALVLFPEGGVPDDPEPVKAKRGPGLLSCNTGAPLVPTLITNTEPKKMLRLSRISIKFFPPIYPPKEYTKEDYFRLPQECLDIIRAEAAKK